MIGKGRNSIPPIIDTYAPKNIRFYNISIIVKL